MIETSRHLPFDGTYNVRDIGGYMSGDGRRTRWRVLLRADSLHRLTEPAQAELIALGVRTIVDLRHAVEQLAAPNVFAGSTAIRYVQVPLLEDPTTRSSSAPSASLAEVYQLALNTRGQQIAAIFNQLAEDDGLPALVHCTAGKDRTGIVSALLLRVAGVGIDEIAADYGLSDIREIPGYGDWLQEQLPPEEARIRDFVTSAPPDGMASLLRDLDEAHGSAAGYLESAGVDPAALAEIRRRLAG
jgi:protein-tyrosine phosphatase